MRRATNGSLAADQSDVTGHRRNGLAVFDHPVNEGDIRRIQADQVP